jgi:hypothetical protein
MSSIADPCGSSGVERRVRIRATQEIENRNVHASTTNAVPGLPIATINPPRAGPSIRRAAGRTS